MPGIIHSARQKIYNTVINLAFSALTLLVGRQEGYSARKKYGGWWRWTLVSPDGVVPSRMVSVSASVNHPLHHKVQKFSSGTSSPGWSRKKGRKTVVVVINQTNYQWFSDLCIFCLSEKCTYPYDTSVQFNFTSCFIFIDQVLPFTDQVLPQTTPTQMESVSLSCKISKYQNFLQKFNAWTPTITFMSAAWSKCKS